MSAVDWGMLAAAKAAGLTEADIRNIDANNKKNAAVTGPAPGNDATVQSAKAYLQNLLSQWGLGGLVGQAWDQATSGYNQDVVINNLRSTDQYKARFPAMAALNARNEGITEQQYIGYETALKTTAMAAGLPPGFYDQPEDFSNFIASGVSVQEYTNRIQQGFAVMQQAPQSVRDEFGKMFGAQGDSALAAYFLDPTRAEQVLTQQLQQAEFAGTGDQMGFHASDDQSKLAAQMGISQQQAQSGFQTLVGQQGLFEQQVGDQAQLTKQTGINAQFGLDPGAKMEMDRRLEQRVAQFQGQPAAPQTEQSGSSGFGVARR